MNGAVPHQIYTFMGFRLDPGARLLASADGRPITLTSRVFDTLMYLVEHRGELLDKDTLMQAIWPDTVVEENSLNRVISDLRKALGETPGEHRFILTEAGRGYRFVAEVQTLTLEPDAGAAQPEAIPSSHSRRGILVLFGLLVLALAGGYLYLNQREAPPAAGQAVSVAAPPAPEEKIVIVTHPQSVAVLPFVNMSPDPDQEYFSDGISEELLNQLAQIKGLQVAGRTSSFYFKGKNEDFKVIGEKLGVAHILEGSVRKAGNRVRINAQLIKAADGYNIWSESYERELVDIFAIQEDIARTVAEALSVTFGLGETTITPGLDGDVALYDRYLRARAQYNQGGPANLERAAALYRELLARNPDYGPARSGLVLTYSSSLDYLPKRQAEIVRNLEALAADAFMRAPDDWTTYFAEGMVHWTRHEWTQAERALVRAEELAPASNVDAAVARARLALHMGDNKEAIDRIRATLRIDPLSTLGSVILQNALDRAGRFDEADAEYQRSLDLPGRPEEIEHNALIRIWNDGNDELIHARFDRFLSHQSMPMPLLVSVREVVDDPDAALALLRSAYDDPANQDTTRQFLIGIYAAHFGDTELGLAAMRRSLADMNGPSIHVLWYADMAAVRRTDGFKALVRDLGLVDYWRTTGDWNEFCHPVGADDFECD